MTDKEQIEIMNIYAVLKTGYEVSWSRIIKAFNSFSTEKNTHRNYKVYKILDYYENHREEIQKIFLNDLENEIETSKIKCKNKL